MTVDELMSLADVYADARGFYLRHIHSPPNIAANRVAGDKLRAALEAVVADAESWRHAKRCVRMDNFGGYVIHPDDPADFNGIVAERFAREVDTARRKGGV